MLEKVHSLKENLSHIHADEAREYLLGANSTVDRVFLSHQTATESNHVSEYETSRPSTPKSPRDVFDFSSARQGKGPNCYQVTLLSVVVIALTIFFLVLFREYIKDVLIWMANLDLKVSFVIFLLLYILVSYPIAWGVILLMIACGYLYGIIYGPIVVEVCSAVGVAVAHVTMKRFCRSFIIRKFYNDNMTAVISVVDGKHGFKVVALTRLTPLPFGLQNSLFSLTNIPLLSYVSATTLGMLPTAILNCYMGTTLRSMSDILTDETNQATGWIILSVQILFSIALMCFVVRKARIELKKTVEVDGACSEMENGMLPNEIVVLKESHTVNGFIDRHRKQSGD
ncbi:transmembrane protein 64-like [Dreissena polymorpha]|uniref:VTT domain-containing protein n=1 Tax=Dreissena polymorpha TaxID=45954 RepID=A0A9D4EC28_DREPO|nr:transmembrane protein 64-like [Dreissena polymorpha]KAH3775976.1 hypothetical protein DPMN_177387 [Dreissena polymorpha]